MEEENLRKTQLLEVLGEISKSENDEVNNDDEKVLQNITSSTKKTNEIMENISESGDTITTIPEILMEMQIFKINVDKFSKVVGRKSEEEDFIKTILETPWEEIAQESCTVIRSLDATPMAYAIDDINVNARAANVQRQKEIVTAKNVKPETVEKVSAINTITNIAEKFKMEILNIFNSNGNTPIPYYKLIINPKDFMECVRNSFLLSFLVKDEIVFLNIKNKQHPLVKLVTKEESEAPNKQFIVTLSEDLIDEMIIYYDIKEPMLKIECDVLAGKMQKHHEFDDYDDENEDEE